MRAGLPSSAAALPIFAVLVFWLNWIPVVGGLVAIVLPVPMALVDPEMTWAAFIVMLIATTVVQIVVDNFIDQIVISRALVLHPLTIMIGLFTSRLLWGIVGMVLSIPLLGSLKTTLAGTAHPYAQALAAVLEGDMQGRGRRERRRRARRRRPDEGSRQRLRVACGRSLRTPSAPSSPRTTTSTPPKSTTAWGCSAVASSPTPVATRRCASAPRSACRTTTMAAGRRRSLLTCSPPSCTATARDACAWSI